LDWLEVALLLGHGAVTSSSKIFVGAVAVLIGAISWSVGIVYSRRSHLSGNPLLLSALSLLSGAVLLLATGTIAGEARGFSLAQVAPRSWLALAYLILFGSVVTFTAYNWLMEHYPPTFVATHTYVNPIVAVFLGWWLAGEKVTINVAIAAALVIVAVFLVDRGMARLEAKN
jgi:drug/metabolite transporter (DMT)-like permease